MFLEVNYSSKTLNSTLSENQNQVHIPILYQPKIFIKIKRVADGERNAPEMQALKDSLAKIKIGLDDNNAKVTRQADL